MKLVGELKAETAALEGQLASTAAHLSQEQASHAVARQLLFGSWLTVGLRVGVVFSGGHPVWSLLTPAVQPPHLVSRCHVLHTKHAHWAAQFLHCPLLHCPLT
jgi:hypothetical protein